MQAASGSWKRQGNRFSLRVSRMNSALSCSELLTFRTLREYIRVAVSQWEVGIPTGAWLSHQVIRLLPRARYLQNDGSNRLRIVPGPSSCVLFTMALRSREFIAYFIFYDFIYLSQEERD